MTPLKVNSLIFKRKCIIGQFLTRLCRPVHSGLYGIAADLSPELSTENVENWIEEPVCTNLVRWLYGSMAHGISACVKLWVICIGLKLKDDDGDRWCIGAGQF